MLASRSRTRWQKALACVWYSSFFSLWNGMWLKVNVGRVAQGGVFCPNVVQQYFKYGNNSYDIGMDKCYSQLFSTAA